VTSSKPSAEFVALWTAHARRVYAYIYSMVPNWSDADDILQETSVVVLEKFDEFQRGTSFAAWACKIAYLKVLEFHKRTRPLELRDELFLNAVSLVAADYAESLDRRLEALAACIARLPEKDRQLIELRYRGDQAIAAMAAKIGRTTSAVYKALSRIHEQLLDCVRRKVTEGDAQ
jgi:RNA polymerase sigma-70 factor (ECF subfamily)